MVSAVLSLLVHNVLQVSIGMDKVAVIWPTHQHVSMVTHGIHLRCVVFSNKLFRLPVLLDSIGTVISVFISQEVLESVLQVVIGMETPVISMVVEAHTQPVLMGGTGMV